MVKGLPFIPYLIKQQQCNPYTFYIKSTTFKFILNVWTLSHPSVHCTVPDHLSCSNPIEVPVLMVPMIFLCSRWKGQWVHNLVTHWALVCCNTSAQHYRPHFCYKPIWYLSEHLKPSLEEVIALQRLDYWVWRHVPVTSRPTCQHIWAGNNASPCFSISTQWLSSFTKVSWTTAVPYWQWSMTDDFLHQRRRTLCSGSFSTLASSDLLWRLGL